MTHVLTLRPRICPLVTPLAASSQPELGTAAPTRLSRALSVLVGPFVEISQLLCQCSEGGEHNVFLRGKGLESFLSLFQHLQKLVDELPGPSGANAIVLPQVFPLPMDHVVQQPAVGLLTKRSKIPKAKNILLWQDTSRSASAPPMPLDGHATVGMAFRSKCNTFLAVRQTTDAQQHTESFWCLVLTSANAALQSCNAWHDSVCNQRLQFLQRSAGEWNLSPTPPRAENGDLALYLDRPAKKALGVHFTTWLSSSGPK